LNRILIYRGALFERSEPFVHYQVKSLIDIADVYLLSHHYINEKCFLLPKAIVKTKIPQKPLNITERIKHLIARKLSGNENRFVPKANKITKKLILSNSLTIVHAHFGNNALRILPLVKELNLKLVVSFHGFDASKLLKDKNYTKHLPALFNTCKKVILCADFMFENLKPYGLRKEQTEVIPYGVDIKKIDSIQSDVKPSCFSIVHSGRLASRFSKSLY
jgi:colanic acid/amylovoran biosynthesis glycosyltransferase